MKPVKNQKYLQYISAIDCQITGTSFEHCVVHHVTLDANRGISQKPSDYRTISIMSDLHMQLHHVGEASFWRNLNLNPFEMIVSNLEGWLLKN